MCLRECTCARVTPPQRYLQANLKNVKAGTRRMERICIDSTKHDYSTLCIHRKTPSWLPYSCTILIYALNKVQALHQQQNTPRPLVAARPSTCYLTHTAAESGNPRHLELLPLTTTPSTPTLLFLTRSPTQCYPLAAQRYLPLKLPPPPPFAPSF